MPRDAYSFRHIDRDDLPLLRRWLAQPHVRATWGDPDEEIALMLAEIDGGDCRMHLVSGPEDIGPMGFAQNWSPQVEGHAHLADLPAGTRNIDTFLGRADLLGQGHGAAFIAAYACKLLNEGAPCIATDPRLDNPRGIAAYRSAGFRDHATRNAEDGAPCLVLRLDAQL